MLRISKLLLYGIKVFLEIQYFLNNEINIIYFVTAALPPELRQVAKEKIYRHYLFPRTFSVDIVDVLFVYIKSMSSNIIFNFYKL